MKLFNEILGFIVLSGPLWLILIIILLGAWITHKAGKRFKSSNSKFMIFAGVFALIFLLLFGDGIAGKIYLKHLCDTKSGFKIYHTVKLPAKYWDEKGKPKYIGANGFVDMKLLPSRIKWRHVDEPFINSLIKIEMWRWELIDKNTKTVLGERITFVRYYGWLNEFSPASAMGESCRDLGWGNRHEELLRKENDEEQKFFQAVFER